MHSVSNHTLHRDRVRRRLMTGRAYFDAASTLESKLADFGPSSVVLKVLAFEVLLKAAIFAHSEKPPGSHNYERLWLKLPDEVQMAVVTFGEKRFAGHVDYADLPKQLRDLRRAFEHYRYDYEKNEGRSPEEIQAASTNWEEPDFEFHPMETEGLILGLEDHLERWLELK